jgi:hypothetical protein
MMDSYEEAKELIKKVIDGIETEVDISLMVAPSSALSILRGFGATEIDLMNTNGWQWDFWIELEYNKEKYTLSGSGFYGEMIFKKKRDI